MPSPQEQEERMAKEKERVRVRNTREEQGKAIEAARVASQQEGHPPPVVETVCDDKLTTIALLVGTGTFMLNVQC